MQRVLILGATSAVAGKVAARCAARGDSLYLVARGPDRLAPVVAELGPSVVGSATYEFTDHARAPAVIADAITALGGLDTVLIAHGLLGDQLASEQDFDAALAVLDVNFVSVIAQLLPLANHFEAQGHGHIAVITSVAGERGRPRNYTYGAAKGGLTIYLQGLRARLWPRVQVLTILLGPVDSPMTVDHTKNALFAAPDDVAKSIVARIGTGAKEVHVPWFWWPIMAVVRNLPQAVFQRFKFLAGR